MTKAVDVARSTASNTKKSVAARWYTLLAAAKSSSGTGIDFALSARALALKTLVEIRRSLKEEGVKVSLQNGAIATKAIAGDVYETSKVKAKELGAATSEIASRKSVQATAASAVGGAMTLGGAGGATGLATGGVMGAVAGLPFALFTLGLSIPIGAAVGGGTGLVVGTAVGASTGALGGGAAGYGVYTKSDDIQSAARTAGNKAGEATNYVKCRASDSVDFARGKASQSVSFAQGVASATRARVAAVRGN